MCLLDPCKATQPVSSLLPVPTPHGYFCPLHYQVNSAGAGSFSYVL